MAKLWRAYFGQGGVLGVLLIFWSACMTSALARESSPRPSIGFKTDARLPAFAVKTGDATKQEPLHSPNHVSAPATHLGLSEKPGIGIPQHGEFKENNVFSHGSQRSELGFHQQPSKRDARKGPELIAYSGSCWNAPLFVYATWDDRAKAKTWRFAVSQTPNTWTVVGEYVKTGIRIQEKLSDRGFPVFTKHIDYVLAEGLDNDGNVVGSVVSKVFVPPLQLRNYCNDEGCWKLRDFDYNDGRTIAGLCGTHIVWSTVTFIMFVLTIEIVGWCMENLGKYS